MNRGENILGKLCFSKNEMMIIMRIAMRKGNGTGIPMSALAIDELDTY